MVFESIVRAVARRRIPWVVVLGGIVGCAPPLVLGTPPAQPVAVPTDWGAMGVYYTDTFSIAIRYRSFSPNVTVVGWDAGQSSFGLRTTLRRDGAIVHQEHQIYINTYFFPSVSSYRQTTWYAFTRMTRLRRRLPFTGIRRDTHACEGSSVCSPPEMVTARVPDSFLRMARDSIVVRVRGFDGSESEVTLPPDLVNAYLSRVEWVREELRRIHS